MGIHIFYAYNEWKTIFGLKSTHGYVFKIGKER